MFNFEGILDKEVNGVLATVTDNDCPDTRIFQSLWCEGNKVYFCTGAYKDVYDQLKANPKASFCVENNNSPVLTINGEVTFVDDISVKEKAFEKIPRLKERYKTVENDEFKVFYIDIKQVKTFSYEEGPKEYNL